jgi:predicted dinucleotide-binding enzyme
VKIAILGATGPAGKGLAARLATAGMKVYAGSRDAQKAEVTVGQLYDRFGHPMSRIEAGSNAEAAEAAEIVLLATTADATVATSAEHAAAMAGKVVVSMANVIRKVQAGFEAVPVEEGSTAQPVQAAAPGAFCAVILTVNLRQGDKATLRLTSAA